MLSSTVVLAALLILAIVGLIQSQPIQDNNLYGFNELEDAEAPYLMNLLKRTAVFFPNGNHDKMIKAILKSRRY
ncbi:Neuropeptide-Like Protein [Caenorhabditis elegans]|uniref:Neuropeptide-Like Protein n=1 Tax=Caenorhabditis elegans TaxID=6239 RepID=Q7YX46_CAEEL|nr:Neuropeptide-Like Protein [Caenorhabditis elegans]CAE17768.1 Neuropeptide-Like Protein [Caenorhabditis elegans]|eukprot:NP_001022059.1 Uncharacterized protein CELE_E04D5.5 [Caenorhabditis elegans]